MEQLMINLAGTGRALGAGMALAWLSWGWGWAGAQDQKPAEVNASTDASDPTAAARNRMVQRHLAERGIKNPRVLGAFRTVPRHRFLPPKTQRQAYDDESIPIGEGQTITPPYDVAFMTEVLDPKPTDKVYEVGTGSGYQAAILSRLVKEVYSVEIHAPLSERATGVHKALGYTNIHNRVGDGYEGWPDAAPFDAIIVTCAPHRIPRPLVDQLKEGGRMVIPLGDRFTQSVHLAIKQGGKLIDRELKPTLFVPMTGKALKEGPDPKTGGEPVPAPDTDADRPRRKRRAGRRKAQEPRWMRHELAECVTFARTHLSRLVRCVPAARSTVFLLALTLLLSPVSAQEPEIERTGPPAADDLEKDANHDGVPDGWYNARDAIWESKGGAVGPHFIRFECTQRGRPARLSRAFGVDGRKTEALVLGLWVKLNNVQYGERAGEEPSLLIDFLGDGLRHLSRGTMGPWTHTLGSQWTRVVKRIPVPPGTRDAIISVGLLGAKGILDMDGLTVELVPVGEVSTTNLVVNGDFELGDPAPAHWIVNNDASRVFPGHRSGAAIELGRSDSRVLTGLALPVEGLGALDLSVFAEGRNLRGSGGAVAGFFFLDDLGRPIPGADVELHFGWGGSFDWRKEVADVRVPPGARRAVLQFEKTDNGGKIRIDDVTVTASPNAEVASWVPFHAAADTDDWLKVPSSPTIAARSALDFSFLIPAPAGQKGFVVSKDGHLTFQKGGRARFHGVSLIAPTAFLEAERADRLADRLARSGINLVRLGDLDYAVGPDRSLYDDSRDDTRAFDPGALKKLDHLVAALKARGIHMALELQSQRRFRDDDGVLLPGLLPPGGGPAALFDPVLTKLSLATARGLLGRVNGETGLALKDDPALAWVTLLGEVSLFDLIDHLENGLPGDYAQALRALGQKSTSGTGRRFWQSLEAAHYKTMVEALRKDKVRVPIAGCSHWRREPEFAAAQAGTSLDLVDDRLFWAPTTFIDPEMKSQLWSLDGGLSSGARRKRHPGLGYVVGQWCPQTGGAWALPHEAADQLLAAATSMNEDWDALVRRGVFMFPLEWGEGPAGTVGGEDIFQIPEVVNGSPHVYALWPHVASMLLRERTPKAEPERDRDRETELGARNSTSRRRPRPVGVPGWDPARGRLVVETPFTQGIAGWFGGETIAFPHLEVTADNPFAVVVVSSVGPEPIATARRLLVTVIGRVEPTGFRWVDRFRREVADPGRPPFLQEPVFARVAWWRQGKIQGHLLNNAGERVGPARLELLPDGAGATLIIDAKTAAFHWELIAE